MQQTIRALFLALSASVVLGGQGKPPVPSADYGPFETLAMVPNRGGLSPDGKWLAYGINRANRNNELRVVNVATGAVTVAAFGAQPSFGPNSRWIAYSIGLSEAQQDKLRKDKKPIRNKLGLLELASTQTTVVDGIESFSFDATGSYLAMRHYAPDKKDASPADGAAAEGDETPPGATLIVRDLAAGRDTTFGNVAEFAWQDKGRLLAMAISAEDKAGNGVQLFDPQGATLRVLDSSPSIYTALAWRKDSADLAVLKSSTDDGRDGPSHVALAWTRLGDRTEAKHVYNPASDSAFPAGMRTVAFRKPSWSEDGSLLFLGVAKWNEKTAARKRTSTPSDGGNGQGDEKAVAADDDEPAGVDVWHSRDIDVMPKQKLSARTDRQRNMLAAWHVESGRFVQLGRESTEQVIPLKRQNMAYATNWTSYAMERSIGRPAADVYLIDLEHGERTKIKERLSDDRYLQASPAGRYLLYLQDDHFWTVNVATRAIVNITKSAATSFVDRESDATVKQKPAYGVAGWTKNDEAVILYDKFDLWKVAADGTRAARLTAGAAEQTRHRYVRINPDDEWIDTDQPIYVSLFGLWTKRSGYARLLPGAATAEAMIWVDKGVGRLAKAKDADVFAYVAEDFDDSPDVFVAGPELKDAKQATRTNPFQDRYAWGHSETIEYRNERGDRLQGGLYYPAGYQAGRRYPMIVYMYERLSDDVHRYVVPDERSPYNAAAFTSLGYFVLQPDILFRPREPGLSVADCVGAAVKKVTQRGLIDPRKVGVVGHSWGGFDTTFLATHTDLFAAAVAGAPITDLVSNYGNHHWSSGIAETDHIETGQQRMEVPLWEDLPAYIRNSALFNVHNMKTPLLIEVGDSDGTVFWHQGVELYNVARRAKKDVVLLVYAGEDHGLRKKPNQLDYHRRIVDWFGHYLKDEPAPPWIASGVSYLDRDQELKELKARKGTSGTRG